MLIGEPTKLYPRHIAERIAAEAQSGDDDGWTYMAVLVPQNLAGLYRVEVRDESGDLVATL